jgi:LCP family protein required for cell wall assembly
MLVAAIATVIVVVAITSIVLSALTNATAAQAGKQPQFITTLFSTAEPGDQSVAPVAAPAATAAVPTVQPSTTPKGDWENGERVTVLLMGLDQRPVENVAYAATDSLILMTMDPLSKTAGMMSIPRDLWVDLTNHGQDRINRALASGGPMYAMQEVGRVLGVPIYHYVRVNFVAMQKIVDLIGGIDVYVDEDINDQSYPDMNYHYDPFVISAGMHHMDGATALKYARTRHGSSDFYRMRRQQQIIMAVRDRAVSIGAIPNLAANASEIMGTLVGAVQTDLSVPVQDYRTNGGAQVLVLMPDKLPDLIRRFYGQP